MASHREAQRAKEKKRKNDLKGTSLARTRLFRPPASSRPPLPVASGSRTTHSATSQETKSRHRSSSSSFDEANVTPMDIDDPRTDPGPSSPSPSRAEHRQFDLQTHLPASITEHSTRQPPSPPIEQPLTTDGNSSSSNCSLSLLLLPEQMGHPSDVISCDGLMGGGIQIGVSLVEDEADDVSDDERPWYLPSEDDRGSSLGESEDEPDTSPIQSSRSNVSFSASESPSATSSLPSANAPIQADEHLIPSQVYANAHSLWYIRIILVVTVYLHFSFHLPYAACNILLFTLSLVLQSLGLLSDSTRMPISLATAIKSLHLRDRFSVYPVCPTCHHILQQTTDSILSLDTAPTSCQRCDTPLFSTAASPLFLDSILAPLGHTGSTSRAHPRPVLVAPYRSVSSLLSEFLSRDGMVAEMDVWRDRARTGDQLRDVMDGRVWKELLGPDQKPFFGNHCPDELRVGLVVQLDWCNFRRSAQSSSHSTGLFSISVANLPESERYQTKNLLIPCIIPGPKEPNTRQLQEYIIIMVDELLQLYERGMSAPSLTDRLVRVAVTLVICNHPAMCKFFGLADKSHENSPCHRCDVKASEWWTTKSLSCGCQQKTFDDLQKQALNYQKLSPSEQDALFVQTGVRWFAFLKLPYFNPLRMAVLDPMHNVLLGLVKTHWYNIWIKQEKALRETTKDGNKRELEDIHNLLKTAEFPSWLGRIPSQIGIPAGGSLSADEWKTLALVFGPLALPIVWDDWIDAAEQEVQMTRSKIHKARERLQSKYIKDMDKWEEQVKIVRLMIREQSRGRSLDERRYTLDDLPPRPKQPELPELPKDEVPRLKRGEMALFLKLSAALTVMLAQTVRVQELERAHQRLLEYLQEYAELYGPKAVKPNFHWATHLYAQILDYGPVYGFWAFLQERLNFIVKGFRTNNHGQGELEVTMMRSYSALTALRDIMSSAVDALPIEDALDNTEQTVLKNVIGRLLGDPMARGTWEAMTQSGSQDLSKRLVVGPQQPKSQQLEGAVATALLHYINSQPSFKNNPVLRPSNPAAVPGRIFSALIKSVNYVMLDGRKIVPLAAKRKKGKPTIVQARVDTGGGERIWVGELLNVFFSLQGGIANDPLALVRWLQPTGFVPLRENIWDDYKDVLDVRVWEYQTYVDSPSAPAAILPFSSILSEAARITVRKEKGSSDKLWLTIGLDKHGTSL